MWLIDWKWVKFETFWKLNEREWNDFPKLSHCIYDLHEYNFFSNTKPYREDDMTSSIINVKGFWKDLNFIWKYFKFRNFKQLNDFSWEKIKWLLQNIWNMSWKFKRIKFKVPLKAFWKLISIWSYLGFIQIIFLQK